MGAYSLASFISNEASHFPLLDTLCSSYSVTHDIDGMMVWGARIHAIVLRSW